MYHVLWNGKVINRVENKAAAIRCAAGTKRDYGPLPAGTIRIRKAKAEGR